MKRLLLGFLILGSFLAFANEEEEAYSTTYKCSIYYSESQTFHGSASLSSSAYDNAIYNCYWNGIGTTESSCRKKNYYCREN